VGGTSDSGRLLKQIVKPLIGQYKTTPIRLDSRSLLGRYVVAHEGDQFVLAGDDAAVGDFQTAAAPRKSARNGERRQSASEGAAFGIRIAQNVGMGSQAARESHTDDS
jgi:hypothetical protein